MKANCFKSVRDYQKVRELIRGWNLFKAALIEKLEVTKNWTILTTSQNYHFLH